MSNSSRRSFLKGAAGTAAAIVVSPEILAAIPSLAAPVRIGLVGAGRQGRAILAELGKFKDVEVLSLCDTDASRLRSGARRAPKAKRFATHKELLDASSDLDAIIVATPTHVHKDVALDALAAGKHVYCEAPLAHRVDDCSRMVEAAHKSQKVFQTGMQGRSNPVYKLARSFYRAGAIRDAIAMRAQFHRKISWVTPASTEERRKRLNWKLDPEVSLGLLGEMGTQQFDVLHWFTSKYPTAVRANGAVLAWKDGRSVADTVHAELVFPGDVRTTYEATLGNSFEGTHEVLAGTMGTIKLAWTHGWMFKEADAATQGWEVYANRQQFHNDEGITLIADATKLAKQGKLEAGVGLPNAPVYYALEDFLKSVTEDKPVVCGAGEGMRAAVVAIKANEALRTGSLVTIDEKLFGR